MNNKFPKQFLWGAATSAPQSEGAQYRGGRTASTWDKWYEKNPERFYNQIGPEHTSFVYDKYREDVDLMVEMNFNSFRTSISWNRLLPDGKTLNEEAVTFYRDYFGKMKENGIEPIINLFHFDMPWWLMEKGGWENRVAISDFAFYAKTAFEQFGDIVQQWTTFNEPIVHVECGYLGNDHWPQVNDFKRAVTVGYHTALAHAAAVREFHKISFPKEGSKIGIILNLTPVYSRSTSKEDLKAKKDMEEIQIRSFLDPSVKGVFSDYLISLLKENELLPIVKTEDAELLMDGKVDFLGVNYYQPIRVQAPNLTEVHSPALSREDFAESYDWPDRKMNPYRGWEIYPEGIYDLAMMIKNDYGNIPWYISENGMGVADEERFINQSGMVEDDYRIEFIRDHLEQALRAIQDGANCQGYHLWTFVDCWSWLNSYKNRYGFYRLDLETGKRSPKKSSFWMRKIIKTNQLDL